MTIQNNDELILGPVARGLLAELGPESLRESVEFPSAQELSRCTGLPEEAFTDTPLWELLLDKRPTEIARVAFGIATAVPQTEIVSQALSIRDKIQEGELDQLKDQFARFVSGLIQIELTEA